MKTPTSIIALLGATAAALPHTESSQWGRHPSSWGSPGRAAHQLVAFFENYFAVKSAHNGIAWADLFNKQQTQYCDATEGECFGPWPTLNKTFVSLTEKWGPNATSQYLWADGDMNSAVIHFVDTPALFGDELRIMSSIDFVNGTIVRQIDYWDGRENKATAARKPRSEYPYDLAISSVKTTAAPEMKTLAGRLSDAFAVGDAQTAGSLFAFNAVFEDWTLRSRLEGSNAIGRYLNRTLSQLPYGPGAKLRHVLGSKYAGGYEWAHNGTDVINGIVNLQMNDQGQITLLRTVWDASFVPNATMNALALLALE